MEEEEANQQRSSDSSESSTGVHSDLEMPEDRNDEGSK